MATYQCILFDLDHTLWDYETNCAEALQELYEEYELRAAGIESFSTFLSTFSHVNTHLWDQYDRGEIDRDVIRFQRFNTILEKLNVCNYDMSLRLSEDYVSLSPKKKNLIPKAKEVLEYLSDLYPLYIITNGFDEIQSTKLESSGIQHYFKEVVTSQKAGYKKPSKEIFHYALKNSGHQPHEAIMIGDNLVTDIGGARNASIDAVYFNPNKLSHSEKVTYEISSLHELKGIL